MEEETKKETLKIDHTVSPISVSKETAYEIAALQESHKNEGINKEEKNDVAEIIPTTKEEIELKKVEEVNNLMKDEFVEIKQLRHSPKLYIIMVLVLLLIIGIIIFELIYYSNH